MSLHFPALIYEVGGSLAYQQHIALNWRINELLSSVTTRVTILWMQPTNPSTSTRLGHPSPWLVC